MSGASGPSPARWRTRDGQEVWLVTRAQLEGAPGWRFTHGGRKGRGACVMHGGDNRQAMEADLESGWIRCRTRGCLGRLADHPDTYGAGDQGPAYGAPLDAGGAVRTGHQTRRPETPPRAGGEASAAPPAGGSSAPRMPRDAEPHTPADGASSDSSAAPRTLTFANTHAPAGAGEGRPRVAGDLTKPDIPRARDDDLEGRLAGLATACEGAAAALPGSPAEAYLAGRRIPLELAARHGLGWATRGTLRGRLVFPLTDPAGRVTSATGRAVAADLEPRYRTLPAADYPKGWHNAGAIGRARSSGEPVYLCEGPFDALALAAGGLETAVAMLGTDDPGRLVAWLAGVRQVIVCLDADEAGQAAARKVAAALALWTDLRTLAPAALAGCGDLAEFWERHGALPAALLAPPAPRPTVRPDAATEKGRPAEELVGEASPAPIGTGPMGTADGPAEALEPSAAAGQTGQTGHPKKGPAPLALALERPLAPDTCEACGAATVGLPGNGGRLKCTGCALEAARRLGLVAAHPLEPAEALGDAGDLTGLEATDAVPTPLPAYPLTCPAALALELAPTAAAYAVAWADDLAGLGAAELAAYAAGLEGGGPMGRAAVLEARHRLELAAAAVMPPAVIVEAAAAGAAT